MTMSSVDEPRLAKEVANFLQLVDAGKAQVTSSRFVASLDPLIDPVSHFEISYSAKRPETLRVEWSETVERAFLERGIKMDLLEEEALRGGTLLFSTMRFLDTAFGKVLIDTALSRAVLSRFATIPAIVQLLHQWRADEDPRSIPRECKAQIDLVFDGYGNSLLLELHYPADDAYAILVGAIFYLIDKRFLISALRRLSAPKKRAARARKK